MYPVCVGTQKEVRVQQDKDYLKTGEWGLPTIKSHSNMSEWSEWRFDQVTSG